MKLTVAEIVTNKIIAQLESGTVPWQKPWANYLQSNYGSKRAYTGFNQFLLQSEAREKGYTSPYWATFAQISKDGGHIKKDSKSTQVVFWKVQEYEKESESGESETKQSLFMRFYNVFNLDQVDGIEKPEPVERKIESGQAVANTYLTRENISLEIGGNTACYIPSRDTICMPTDAQFIDSSKKYATLFHEMVHSTGHEKRLNRKEKTATQNFGSEEYSKEELVAELGASMLCYQTGIEPEYDQSSAYIASWLKALKNDRNLLISASSKADKAVQFIMA